MGLETGTYVSDLVSSNPIGSIDTKSQGDDHLRLIKSVLQTTFPNASRAFYFESIVAKTGAYSIVAADQRKLILADATTAAFTITLPQGSSVFAGFLVSIMKSDSSGNAITVDGFGGETIHGATTRTLGARYNQETYIWDGAEWKVLGNSGLLDAPSGTKMLFQQTTPPTGWTKDTTHNDKALRVVSGTPGSGGTNAFSSGLGATFNSQGHTLLTSEIPSHTHTGTTASDGAHTHSITRTTPFNAAGGATSPDVSAGPGTINTDSQGAHTHTFTSDATGGGGAHSHDLAIDIQYVDLVIATKD